MHIDQNGLMASTIKLTGHQGDVLSTKFSKCGNYLASAGRDRQVLVWDIFSPQCRNLGVCKGHKNAIIDLKWDSELEDQFACKQPPRIHTCSADKTLITWDTVDFSRIRSYKGHTDIVNSVDCSYKTGGFSGTQDLLVSGSDDGTVKIWDFRDSKYMRSFNVGYQVMSVAFSKNNDLLFFGGLDNSIRAVNLRTNSIEYSLLGHTDTVTGLALSHKGDYLLSNGMDNTVRLWDVRPYVAHSTRMVRLFTGATHNFEKNLLRCGWSGDDSLVTAGSADRTVNIWETDSGKLRHRLGGHSGSVNDV
jgi:Prp8 binding protein